MTVSVSKLYAYHILSVCLSNKKGSSPHLTQRLNIFPLVVSVSRLGNTMTAFQVGIF